MPSTQLNHISPVKKSHFSRKHLDHLRICVFIGQRRQHALVFHRINHFSHRAHCSPTPPPPPPGKLCSSLSIPWPRSLDGSPLLLKSSTSSHLGSQGFGFAPDLVLQTQASCASTSALGCIAMTLLNVSQTFHSNLPVSIPFFVLFPLFGTTSQQNDVREES